MVALPEWLLTQEDLAAFSAGETERCQHEERLSGLSLRRFVDQKTALRYQEVWLWVEHLFDAYPTVDALKMGLERDESVYCMVVAKLAGEDDFEAFGTDSTGAAEHLQELLNDNRDLMDVLEAMDEEELSRDNWIEHASEFLGQEWRAARDKVLLNTTLSSETGSPITRGPRL